MASEKNVAEMIEGSYASTGPTPHATTKHGDTALALLGSERVSLTEEDVGPKAA